MSLKEDDYIKYLLKSQEDEVELYWKRATYFWTFVGAIFAGYFLILNKGNDHIHLKLLIESLGIIFSFSWYLVNRGSQYWNEYWIDKIKAIKSAYEIYTDFPFNKELIKIFCPLEIFPFDVAKINLILSLFIFLLWVVLFLYTVCDKFSIFNNCHDFIPLFIIVFIICFIVVVLCRGREKNPRK